MLECLETKGPYAHPYFKRLLKLYRHVYAVMCAPDRCPGVRHVPEVACSSDYSHM